MISNLSNKKLILHCIRKFFPFSSDKYLGKKSAWFDSRPQNLQKSLTSVSHIPSFSLRLFSVGSCCTCVLAAFVGVVSPLCWAVNA